MANVLLVEDDPVLGRGLHVSLELEGYQVTWVQNLASASTANEKQSYDLVILDQGLPDGNGTTFLKKLRDAGSRIPVLILTAKTDEDSVVAGLQAGANDYVRKPFGKKELSARIKTALREVQTRDPQSRYGDLLLLKEQRRVMFDGNEIDLKRREFDVLCYMIQHADKVVTRDDLINAFDKDSDMLDRTIDTHISHIRGKLKRSGVESVQISSVYGVGYRLEKK